MSDAPKTPTIMLKFKWASLQPDYRAYKPANPLILADMTIGVEVPLTTDYIYNATAIAIQQISGATQDELLLTPKCMRYVIDQFESVMSDNKRETTESTNDAEWAEVEEEVPAKKSATKDDEWDESETDEPSVEKSDEKWDEDWS